MAEAALSDILQPALNASARLIPRELALAHIAIVDDDPLNVRLIRRQLEKLGFSQLLGVSNSLAALDAFEKFRPDVVLMDVVMPGLTGPELLARLRQHPQLHDTPVITLTASRERVVRLQVLELGVADFLSKPIDEAELFTRLRNVLEAKRYRDQLSQSAQKLELAVQQRTRELEASRREVMLCLARAAEYRDDNTGQHVIRVGRYAAILASELKLPQVFVEMIELAAQLHDVGKIGIPDAVLHKPGKLSEDEMSIMRRHADFGWRIIAPLNEPLLDPAEAPAGDEIKEVQSPMLIMAAKIAASHHERWDGKGYPQGISGCEIPLEARITAAADVFDALSTSRCYKPAFPLDKCFAIIESERGRHFDPQVADACASGRSRLEETYHQFAQQDSAHE